MQLGDHFDVYSQYGINQWPLVGRVGAVSTGVVPPSMKPANSKLPGASISGNFGEVLTVMALEAKVAPRNLQICHLCPVQGHTKIKCPDLLLETSPFKRNYKIFKNKTTPSPPDMPQLIPGECKNNDFLKALRQLARYWVEVGPSSPVFGFGLISSINYRTPCNLKFNLLVPMNKAGLYTLLTSSSDKTDTLRQWELTGLLYGF